MVHLYCLSDQSVQDGELMHNVFLCGCAAYHPVGCKRALMINIQCTAFFCLLHLTPCLYLRLEIWELQLKRQLNTTATV